MGDNKKGFKLSRGGQNQYQGSVAGLLLVGFLKFDQKSNRRKQWQQNFSFPPFLRLQEARSELFTSSVLLKGS